jgi:hypothetical protein
MDRIPAFLVNDHHAGKGWNVMMKARLWILTVGLCVSVISVPACFDAPPSASTLRQAILEAEDSRAPDPAALKVLLEAAEAFVLNSEA